MNRTLRLAFLLVAASSLALAAGFLLVSETELQAARDKAARHKWAGDIRDEILKRAERALAAPVEIPDRGGQWPHWYSCPRDGVRLETVSPTRHRCPKCGAEYSGEPYDSVPLYGIHRRYSNAIRDLGLAYRLTGKEAFAKRAAKILLAYADRYRDYPLHDRHGNEKTGGGRIMAQTLDESVWLIPVAFGYALVKDTLSAADRRHIEHDLFLPAADLIRRHEMKIHNIQCWKNSAVGLAGFVTGNDELIRDAIEHPVRGFHAQIEKGVTADGLWYEGSLGYHRYTMDALWSLAEAARNNGIDLYTNRYRSLYDAPIALALPNGDSPGFNDNDGGNIYSYARLYELAYARWQRPEYGRLVAKRERKSLESLLYGAATVPSGAVVPKESVLLGDAGYAVLRSPAMTAVMRFGMHGGGHGHPDKLNLVTHGSGRQGGLDPGSINYGVPLHREWYKSTIAHNTVSVDGTPQRPVDGRKTAWTRGGASTTFSAQTDGAYPGVSLSRTLTLDGEKLLDVFECASDAGHTYDWAFHAPGKLSLDIDTTPASGPLGRENGYQHLQLERKGRANSAFTATWNLGGARLTITIKGEPGTELFLANGPGRDPAEPVSCLVVRRTGNNTTFHATHEFRFRGQATKSQNSPRVGPPVSHRNEQRRETIGR